MELEQLKKVLRSIVVSSPTAVDMRSLTRDFRNMMGEPIPVSKYGYRDLYTFLKERCADSFLMSGPDLNPTLTLIVPKSLQHIDEHVRRQKTSSTNRFKGKRQSISETAMKRQTEVYCPPHMRHSQHRPPTNPAPPKRTSRYVTERRPITKNEPMTTPQPITRNEPVSPPRPITKNKPMTTPQPITRNEPVSPPRPNRKYESSQGLHDDNKVEQEFNVCNGSNKADNHTNHTVSDPAAMQKFFKKRLPPLNHEIDEECATIKDDDSPSSCSSGKRVVLSELRSEIRELVSEHPEGLWSADLLRLYRERYGREVPVERLGISSSIQCLARKLSDVFVLTRPEPCGDWRVWDARVPPPAPPPRRQRLPHAAAADHLARWDDALPGIDFDASVFPEDCMHYVDSIPPVSLDDVAPQDMLEISVGEDASVFPEDCMHYVDSIPPVSLDDVAPQDMLEISVGEVYSPSHLWVMRLGEQHLVAMENIMDEMTKYYSTGEGRSRVLSPGAVRAGHYCTSLYERDWHRSLIVQVIDVDTVKVRHVDYGTVCRAATANLKPLRREWAQLPAQAARARLAGIRPAVGSRRWPHAAASKLLDLVRDKKLVGSVVAVDYEESILELFLVDTSTDEDICINSKLVTLGFADTRRGSALHDQTPEAYLYPRFEALEAGETPNYEEISKYLRTGISLEYVEEYRRHVPLGEDYPRGPSSQLGMARSRASQDFSRGRSSQREIDYLQEACGQAETSSVSVANRIPMPLPAAAAAAAAAAVLEREECASSEHLTREECASSEYLTREECASSEYLNGLVQLRDVRTPPGFSRSSARPPRLGSEQLVGQSVTSSRHIPTAGRPTSGSGQLKPGAPLRSDAGYLQSGSQPKLNFQPSDQSPSLTGQFQPVGQPTSGFAQIELGGQAMPGNGQFLLAGQPTPTPGFFQPGGQPTSGSGQFQPIGQPTPTSIQYQPTPTSVQYQPTPTSVQYQPTPTSVQYQPTPTSVQYQPTPTSVQYQPTPTSVQYQPTPTSVQYQPTPTSVQYQPTPTSVQYQPTPTSGQYHPMPAPEQYQSAPPPRYPPGLSHPGQMMNQLNMLALHQHRGGYQYPSQYNAALLRQYHHYAQPQLYVSPPPPPPPRAAPPPPSAPAAAAPSPAQLQLTDVEVRVYLQLLPVDARTAADHLLTALERAGAAAGADAGGGAMRVRRLDADIFRKLVAVDADTAHRHMRAVLQPALAAAAPQEAGLKRSLNPMAREFSAPVPAPLQPAVRQFFDDASASVRAPPGFDAPDPAPLPAPAPAPAPESPDVDVD